MGRSGIRAAYATGRGKIILRARTEFEEFGRDRTRIIVTELPYQVNKRMLIKNMADQVNDKRLEGISDIRDETDRTGMRIVIEVKHDANPQVVLNRLFAQTQLQTSFAINMLALVDNQKQPKILSLRHIIDEYLAFQEELITRRTQYDLKKAREREHLLQGLTDRAGQHRRGHPHHPHELRRREGKADGTLLALRRAGAGHSRYAPEGLAGPRPRKSSRTSLTSWKRRSHTLSSFSPTRRCSRAF